MASNAPSSSSAPTTLDISGSQWSLSGPVTFETVAKLELQLDASRASAESITLAQVTDVDSSAVGLMLAIKRRHPNARFHNVPQSLNALAALYDVTDLLQ
jgi:ABC-type transporter Mla MlaB component